MGGPSSTEEAKASTLFRWGSLAAILGSVVALGAPTVLLLLAAGRRAGLSPASSRVLEAESLLVVAGAVLLLLALFLYRRAFVRLKHVDRRLRPVADVCLVGTVGAVVLVVVGAVVADGASSLTGCLGGHAAHALGCLRSDDPTVGYLAIAGFWLLWAGMAAVAAGLILAGRHFGRRAMTAGGAVYAILAADVAVPFAAVLVPLSAATAYPLGAAPVLAVAAAGLVYVGARSALAHDR